MAAPRRRGAKTGRGSAGANAGGLLDGLGYIGTDVELLLPQQRIRTQMLPAGTGRDRDFPLRRGREGGIE